MGNILKFEELYNAYLLCLKNKKRKAGTFNFVNSNLCENLINLLDSLNNRTYKPQASNCYVITDPALREIYAAQFRDRIVQHFYMKEIEEILDKKLVDNCCSCRKGKGTDYALILLKKYLVETSNNGKKDCYFLKIDLSGYFMSIDRKQISDKFEKLIVQEYTGKHKELLLYLTPIIFKNNPAQNCKYKCNENVRNNVPERRKMNPKSEYGMAIGYRNYFIMESCKMKYLQFKAFTTILLSIIFYFLLLFSFKEFFNQFNKSFFSFDEYRTVFESSSECFSIAFLLVSGLALA